MPHLGHSQHNVPAVAHDLLFMTCCRNTLESIPSVTLEDLQNGDATSAMALPNGTSAPVADKVSPMPLIYHSASVGHHALFLAKVPCMGFAGALEKP